MSTCPDCGLTARENHYCPVPAKENFIPVEEGTRAYHRGRTVLRDEIESWLDNSFEYENSALTVGNIREILHFFTKNDNKLN
jgi:ribosomal protein L32